MLCPLLYVALQLSFAKTLVFAAYPGPDPASDARADNARADAGTHAGTHADHACACGGGRGGEQQRKRRQQRPFVQDTMN